MTDIYCISCKRKIANQRGASQFKCPKCMKVELVRCSHCRSAAIKYKCPECGFAGPN